MLYNSADEYLNATHKSVALFAMSGLGKSYLSNMLRLGGDWFHYNVDYRIGTRYMSEPIADKFKHEAMKSPFFRELLLSDSVAIKSRMTFDNLIPLSTYLGKPGDTAKGGIAIDDYMHRQALHRRAEIAASRDAAHFKTRAHDIYGYPNFIADMSGSFCEILDNDIAACDLMRGLSKIALPVWIEGTDAHREELVRRFKRAPKPMYYQPDFLAAKWDEYLTLRGVSAADVDPDDFIVWGYGQLLDDRMPRYRSMAKNWGITVSAEETKNLSNADEFNALIASKLG